MSRCHTGRGGHLRREDQVKEPQAKAREGVAQGQMRPEARRGGRVPEREGCGPPGSLHAACRLRGKAKGQAAPELPRVRPAWSPQRPGGLRDSPEGQVAASEAAGSEPGLLGRRIKRL